jgi:methyl-accepting chemotaxis protein
VFQESAQAFSAIGDMIRDITEGVLQIAWGQASAGPLIKGVRFANQVAEGDLTARIEVDQKDEVGELAAALKQMIAKLANIVMEVKRAADNVASGSQEMSASSEEMSQGATEQAASAEEASSSMEQMAANIKQNADNALQAEKDEALKKMDCSYPEQSGSGFEINRTDIGGNGDHKDADFERY